MVDQNYLDKVNTIPELSVFLTDLKSKQDNESALAYAITAQLQVLTVLQHPKMTASPFDLMLESLKTAVQKANSEQEKSMLQQKAAIMINSMVFFMEAKLYYEDDKWKKEGQDLLKEACEMVADSACAIIAMTSTGGLSLGVFAKKFGVSLFTSIMENKGGFIKRIMDWYTKGKRLAEYKYEFFTFLESAFEKIYRYKNLFGQQLLLRNLVLRYKEDLSSSSREKSRELYKLDPDNPILKNRTGAGARFFYYSVSAFFMLLCLILGFSYLFYLFSLFGGDKWVENLANSAIFYIAYNIHFGLLDLPLIIKIIIVGAGYFPAIFAFMGISYYGYSNIDNIHMRKWEVANEYYAVLADKLDEFEED